MTSLQSKPSCYHTTRLHINSTSHTSQSRCRNCRDFDVTAMLSSVFLATECCKLRWPINVLERRRVVWSCISASTYVWQNNGKAALSWQHVMGLLCAVVWCAKAIVLAGQLVCVFPSLRIFRVFLMVLSKTIRIIFIIKLFGSSHFYFFWTYIIIMSCVFGYQQPCPSIVKL